MKRRIRLGVIGCGMVAHYHMKNLMTDDRVELLWIAEISKKALKAAGEEFAVPNATTDYKVMLEDPALDAVVVSTPPTTHAPIGIAVMRAGKHLMLEKPIAHTVSDARKLLRESEKHPHLTITDCSCRHARLNPKFRTIKKFIASGKIGRVYHIHYRSLQRQQRSGVEYHPSAKWFLNRALSGGGPLNDFGVYPLSFHLGVVGEPTFISTEAFCIGRLDKVDPGTPIYDVEEHGGALMKFSSGLSMYWEIGYNAHSDDVDSTTIYGTTGGLQFAFGSWSGDNIKHFYIDNEGAGKPRYRTLKVSHKNHIDDTYQLDRAFIDAIAKKKGAPMPFSLAVKNLEIIHQVYKAADW